MSSPDKETSKLLFENGVVAESLPKYGKAVVMHKDVSTNVLDVPYYDRAHKLDILKRNILPNGRMFDTYALRMFAILNEFPYSVVE